jgi:hypothetical protein
MMMEENGIDAGRSRFSPTRSDPSHAIKFTNSYFRLTE